MSSDVRTEAVAEKSRLKIFTLYVIIAYAISWGIEIPLALKAQGWISADVPFSMHYLAAFGPFVAGILLTVMESGRAGLRDLFSRVIRWNVHPIWWIVALSPLLLFLIVASGESLIRGTPMNFGMLRRFDFLPDYGAALVLVWLATYGFGEETGWRGFLLPRLQNSRSAWSASLILWIIWAAWHIPSFFYLHTAPNALAVAGFLIGVLAGSILLTWLYNSSGGSVLLVAVWHGLFDYVTACTECKAGVIAASASILVMICAAAIVLLCKKEHLAMRGKHAL